ncbi:MAG TPA: PAS domain-containing sensor histidine kinase [Ktedonobacterales bacterium]|nr:PAS domain-containing sensor histidine kinase [Ktedonobacterales bacterium]
MSDTSPSPAYVDSSLPVLPGSPLAASVLSSAILEALADAVIVYDAVGRVVGGNPAAVDLIGLDLPGRRKALAAPIGEREAGAELLTLQGEPLPRDEWPAVRVLRGEALTGEHTVDLLTHTVAGQERILNVSGAPLLDSGGEMVGAVCAARDITARKQLEYQLAERAAELETIFATQVEGVVLIAADGHIVRMNEAQQRLLAARGIEPTARIETWAQQNPPCDAAGQVVPRERLVYYRALHGETVTGEQALELYHRIPEGGDLVLRISGAPVRDPQGHIVGVVLTSYDVTQQRLLERQRLDIMRVVVHDLNNPVSALRLYVQMQQRRLAQGQPPLLPGDQLLSQMDYGLARMQRLLDDLRVATKVELGTLDVQRTRHDVAALCREEAAAQQAVTGRAVQVQTPPQPVWVEVDAERIGQVIANLLTNALKYSPPDRPVYVTVGTADGMARVVVRDEGPGIPSHEQQHLFEQFHRVAGIETQDGSGGLGLGLYISKAIVTQHDGEMGVESAVGHGSTFWFNLPLSTST